MDQNNNKKNIDKRHIDKVEETDTHYIIHYLKDDDIDEEVEDDLEDDLEDDIYNRNINIKGLERRNFTNSEIRVENAESREVVGYASVFTDADGNEALSENLGGFRERISKNAFDSVLDNDVRALFNHNPDLIMGRTKAGTLKLSVDERGLKYNFTAPDTTAGKPRERRCKSI